VSFSVARDVDTHRKRSAFFVAANSIQLKPKAMMLEAVMETKMNLRVSTVPQRRSRYLRAAGTKMMVPRN